MLKVISTKVDEFDAVKLEQALTQSDALFVGDRAINQVQDGGVVGILRPLQRFKRLARQLITADNLVRLACIAGNFLP